MTFLVLAMILSLLTSFIPLAVILLYFAHSHVIALVPIATHGTPLVLAPKFACPLLTPLLGLPSPITKFEGASNDATSKTLTNLQL